MTRFAKIHSLWGDENHNSQLGQFRGLGGEGNGFGPSRWIENGALI